jgi:hypothetical protein
MRRIVLLLLLVATTTTAKLYCDIPAADEVCFLEDVEPGAEGLRGSFEVVSGGNLDVDVRVFVANKLVFSQDKVNKHDFDVRKGQGRYKVCFGNRFSTMSAKTVAFSLHGGLGELIEDEDVAKHSLVPPLQRMVDVLADKVQKMHEHEEYLLERMNRHIETSHSTSARVMLSTGIEACVLVCVNLLQIVYLKRYFERRRRV